MNFNKTVFVVHLEALISLLKASVSSFTMLSLNLCHRKGLESASRIANRDRGVPQGSSLRPREYFKDRE